MGPVVHAAYPQVWFAWFLSTLHGAHVVSVRDVTHRCLPRSFLGQSTSKGRMAALILRVLPVLLAQQEHGAGSEKLNGSN